MNKEKKIIRPYERPVNIASKNMKKIIHIYQIKHNGDSYE